uniref:Thioredoxin domain-containing protein n=1 Tax=Proboscia inermis TaxID=420281 RepID=A0A7S0CGI4_9STRA|mmetsp:Transcript_53021/g.61949  ORF Transcript_53021/g.61949 Transcript_53021/m.61949 type:complete len:155 (+) Transcript_53021:622-1086(+)
MEPAYQSLAKQMHSTLKTSKRKVMIASIDGAKERALMSRFNVLGFPKIVLIDGWSVRDYAGTRTASAMKEFCMTTYVDIEPIPFLNSPFGPIGQSRGLLIQAGATVMNTHETIINKWGWSSLLAGAFMCFFGVILALLLIIGIGILTLPKEKHD